MSIFAEKLHNYHANAFIKRHIKYLFHSCKLLKYIKKKTQNMPIIVFILLLNRIGLQNSINSIYTLFAVSKLNVEMITKKKSYFDFFNHK